MARDEDLFLAECSSMYPPNKLSDALGDSHEVVSTIVSPHLLGHPVVRCRRFSAGIAKRSMVWTGPSPSDARAVQLAFDKLFRRVCVLSGDEYMIAPSDEVEAEQLQMARLRGTHLPPGHGLVGTDLDRATMPSGMRLRSQKLQSGNACRDFFADLKDHDKFQKSPSNLWPVMLTNSVIWSKAKGRNAVFGEYISAQGVPYYEQIAGRCGVSPLHQVFRGALREGLLTANIGKTMVGNAMHAGAFTAWILFIMANTRPAEQYKPYNEILNEILDEESEEVE